MLPSFTVSGPLLTTRWAFRVLHLSGGLAVPVVFGQLVQRQIVVVAGLVLITEGGVGGECIYLSCEITGGRGSVLENAGPSTGRACGGQHEAD